MKAKIHALAWWGSVLTTLVGCGVGAPVAKVDPQALPFVQCKLQIGGQEVEDAVVQLHAKNGQNQKIVSYFDSDTNTYRFVTEEGGAKKGGAPAGEYTMSVAPGPSTTTPIPAKYSDPATSGLIV